MRNGIFALTAAGFLASAALAAAQEPAGQSKAAKFSLGTPVTPNAATDPANGQPRTAADLETPAVAQQPAAEQPKVPTYLPAIPAVPVAAQQPVGEQPKAPKSLLGSPTMPAGIMAPLTNLRPSGMWFTSDYLLWWTKSASAPPLAITGPTPGVNVTTATGPVHIPTSPGFEGLFTINSVYNLSANNATGTLFGNEIHNPLSSGARFTLGDWLDNEQTFGVEARYMFLLKTWATFGMGPNGGVLAIPYTNAVSGVETSYPINLPQTATGFTRVSVNTTPDVFVGLYNSATLESAAGKLNIRSTSELQGGEANAVWSIGRGANWHLEGIGGFRFIELDETLGIDSTVANVTTQTTQYAPALGLPTGNTLVVNQLASVTSRIDSFETHNSFSGGQLGLRGEYQWGRFSISAGGQVGLGVMHETVDIDGGTAMSGVLTQTPSTNIHLAGIPLTVASGASQTITQQSNSTRGGLFAQPTNIGQYTRNAFAVVPEGVLKVNYRFTERVTGSIGYTFLYMSSVAHPGDQINTTVNPTLLTTPPNLSVPPQPIYQFRSADYWAQGINFGVEVRY
jgi:hypothetical protein